MSLPTRKNSRAKIERADEHIQNLATDVQRFIDSRPYRIVREPNPNGGVGEVDRIFWNDEAFAQLTRFGVIVGEIAHAMRSSLNHLVFDLVGGKNTTKTEFPIFIDREKYKAESPRKIEGVPDKAIALFENAQPYNGFGVNDPLWLVHNLDITDKHHVLLVLAAPAIFDRETMSEDLPNKIRLVKTHYMPLEHGTVIGYLMPNAPAPEEMKMYSEMPLQVVLPEIGTTKLQPVVPFLAQVRDLIVGTLEIFDGI